MAISAVLPESGCDNPLDRLPYFVDWRPRLWTPAVRWLLGDPERFRGKKVLELGSRTGRMASLFGLLGAEVLGVDLPRVSLDSARREAASAGVSDRVRFANYNGDPRTIPDGNFDFVFSKSVFVMIPDVKQFSTALAAKMKPDAELIVAENLAGGLMMRMIRQVVHWHRGRVFLDQLHGVDAPFLVDLGSAFEITEQRNFYRLVAAIRARRR